MKQLGSLPIRNHHGYELKLYHYKIIALKSLKYKLYVFNYEKNVMDKDLHEKIKQKASFGSQIRNYILFPYKSIKDTRTATEVLNVNSILSGNIDIFVISFLFWKKI